MCSREEGLCGCAEGGPVGSEEQSGRVWVWTGGTGKEPTEAARFVSVTVSNTQSPSIKRRDIEIGRAHV